MIFYLGIVFQLGDWNKWINVRQQSHLALKLFNPLCHCESRLVQKFKGPVWSPEPSSAKKKKKNSHLVHYIMDKAVWSSSADLCCESCCIIMKVKKKKKKSIFILLEYTETTPETTPLQIDLYFIPVWWINKWSYFQLMKE